MNAALLSLDQASHMTGGAGLAGVGSNVSPWVFGAGLVILLGALIVTIVQLVRMRQVPPEPGEHEAPPADEAPDEPISPEEPR